MTWKVEPNTQIAPPNGARKLRFWDLANRKKAKMSPMGQSKGQRTQNDLQVRPKDT